MMRSPAWIGLLLVGCAAAPTPEPASQETAAVVIGVALSNARTAATRKVRAVRANLPKPLAHDPASVAARMAGALDQAVDDEKHAAAEERRRRQEQLERSIEQFESVGRAGIGWGTRFDGPGLGTSGAIGRGTGGGVIGIGRPPRASTTAKPPGATNRAPSKKAPVKK